MDREQTSSLTWSSGVGQALWGTQTADDYINNLHVDANARPLGHLKFIGPAPGHFLLCKSPGAGHTFRCKSPGVPGGEGGMVTGQIDICITSAEESIVVARKLTQPEKRIAIKIANFSSE